MGGTGGIDDAAAVSHDGVGGAIDPLDPLLRLGGTNEKNLGRTFTPSSPIPIPPGVTGDWTLIDLGLCFRG
jgi:hypothetical protein